MDTVHFTIHRKAALSGVLLPDPLYINGRQAGTLRSGKSLFVDVPRADVYYIETDFYAFSEQNAVVCDNGQSERRLLLKRAGGWRRDSYNEFYIEQAQGWTQAPSLSFDKIISAAFADEIGRLSPEEQALALCLEFDFCVRDDLTEALSSPHLFSMIEALRKIGAHLYADLFQRIVREDFGDVPLPLDDGLSERLQDRIERANRAFFNKRAYGEFHRAAACYLVTEVIHTASVF